ncbi:MAG: hypothetical protein LBQ74_13030 [Prevotella sp.]|jgi:hypothetical protein|nr:hypothetical protein [Prevotella sp.]
MIYVSVNDAIGEMSNDFKSIDVDAMLRAVASNILPKMRKRVHVEGLDADGSQIGTYSAAYMKVRTGNYGNSGKKDSGFFTKGKSAVYDTKSKKAVKYEANKKTGSSGSSMRPKYNRGDDPKVILSLTSQMEQHLTVIQISDGYGLGYENEFDYNKAVWNETRYKKSIWGLSVEELDNMEDTINEFLNAALE